MARSFDEVQQAADAALAKLQERETEIHDEIQKLKDANQTGPFPDAVKKKLGELHDELDALLAVMGRTTDITLLQLDATDDIKKIANPLDRITADLQAKLARLKAIGGGAQAAGDVLTKVDGLVTKAKALVDKAKAPA